MLSIQKGVPFEFGWNVTKREDLFLLPIPKMDKIDKSLDIETKNPFFAEHHLSTLIVNRAD